MVDSSLAVFGAPAISAIGRATATCFLRPDQRGATFGQCDADRCYFSVLNFDLNLRRLRDDAIEEGDPQSVMTGRKRQTQNFVRQRIKCREDVFETLRAVIEALTCQYNSPVGSARKSA